MADRRQVAEDAGIAHQDVEALPALVDARAQAVDGVVVGEIEGHEGGGAADVPDGVVEFFECALRAGGRDDVGTGLGQGEGGGATDAARGTGDDGKTAGKTASEGLFGLGHRRLSRLRPASRGGAARRWRDR